MRFAFWGAEESGLLGSTHYVDSLSPSQARQDLREPELRHARVAELRPVRLRRRRLGCPTSRPSRLRQIETIFNNYFACQGLATEPTAFDGRSDYGPFIEVGIPAGGLFSGAEGVKTPEEAAIYGGTAGEPYDSCYHQACDDINNLSTKALFEFGDGAAHAVLTLAKTKSGFFEDGSKKAGPKKRSVKARKFNGAAAQALARDASAAGPRRAASGRPVALLCGAMADFDKAIADGYATDGPAIELGRGVLGGELHQAAAVRIPLAMMNRHGLVAGATGTGKTRTLQLLAESLSAAGRARVRGRRQGRPVRHVGAGRGRQGGGEAADGTRHSVRAEGLPDRVPRARRDRRRRAGARDGVGLRAAAARPRSSARTRRRSRASGSSSTTPTRRGCRWSTSPTCARC